MELAPSSQFITRHISLRGRRCSDIVHVEYLAQDFPMVSALRCESLYRLTYPFEYCLAVYGQGLVALSLVVWDLGVGNALLGVTCLLFNVAFLTLYAALSYGDHF